MKKPFKFRHVNEIVGLFVLAVVAVLIAGIILAGRAQDWFEPVYRVRLDFPPEGSLGLQKGAEVQILGTRVGRVEGIRVWTNGTMHARLSIKGDFIRFVREDSKAIVKKKFGVAGDSYVEITEGRGEELGERPALPALKDTEITEVAQTILKQIQEAILPLLESYTKLAQSLQDENGPLMKLLANLETVSRGLAEGEGSAGQLLRDPKAAEEIEHILDQVKAILADLKETSARLPPMAATVGREVDALPGTVVQSQETLRETERLIEGIQQHWLIRNYIPSTKLPDMIPALEAGGP
ncbi:MAG: MlaD family protein [Kiritimatiellae bacterium]|nr:MlaD family protein [Kiritimatiellia bacterium]MCO5060463.1 MlaD family protein [Kiritimatiellia bacterium]MCO6400660.1 MCE family protein [Verrucomicrobiota bacterium]